MDQEQAAGQRPARPNAAVSALPYVGLTRRRGWARIRAAVACLIGVLVFALTAAALVLIVIGALARFWSWITDADFFELAIWDLAPGGATTFGATTVVISFLGAFWWFWVGAERRILAEIGARPIPLEKHQQLRNVVEALAIGLGRTPPTLWVCDDPTPNAVSARGRSGGSLCLTSGALGLPRDELEALCAHEMAHLCADDAHWVTSGLVALARARRFGSRITIVGTVLTGVVVLIWQYADIALWSVGAVGLLLLALGTLSRRVLRRLELSVRRQSDEIADVAAVLLARNPLALGALCARLAKDVRRISRAGWRTELMWFEAVEDVADAVGPTWMTDTKDHIAEAVAADGRSRTALVQRAVAAYAEARVPLPPSIDTLRGPAAST